MPGAGGDSDAVSGPRHTIGDLLRDTRKSYGGDINHIAATLRIRASYLTAIEQSQYDKLPGPVYAQGFVRAYAVHLGLDGEEAIRRFKQEAAGLEISRDLSFPVPLAARSIPGGTMVLAALILALCGYGLWYYVSTNDRSHPERVSAVPSDLVATTRKPAPDVVPPTAAMPASVPATTAPLSAQPGAPAAPTAAAANAPTLPASAATPPPITVTLPPMTVTTPSPTMSLPPGVSIAPPVATPATAGPQAAPGLATPPAPVVSPTQTASATATAVPPPSDATTATTTPPDTAPRVYGAAPDIPTRIVVRAIKESWVQIRNGDEVLVQRTLRPGDAVRVPDIRGLSLRTGNGAGIQFEIDGKLFKPLSGTVRTLVLDPDRLVANNGSPPRPVEFNPGSLPRPAQ